MSARRVPLGELCEMDRQGIRPDDPLTAELPFVGVENVAGGTGLLHFDTDSRVGDQKSTAFRFDPRYVLYGKLHPYLNKVAVPDFAGRCSTELVPLIQSNLPRLARFPQNAVAQGAVLRVPLAGMVRKTHDKRCCPPSPHRIVGSEFRKQRETAITVLPLPVDHPTQVLLRAGFERVCRIRISHAQVRGEPFEPRHGSITSTPIPQKSRTFRVATAIPRETAIAAI